MKWKAKPKTKEPVPLTPPKLRNRSLYQQYDGSGNLFCYKCLQYKSAECFDHNSTQWFREYRDRRCKECKENQRKKRLIANRGKQDINTLLDERWRTLKDRAYQKEIPCEITPADLKELWIAQDGKCALSGIEMTAVFYKGRIPTNISVDRIDSHKGYTKDNIQLVCMACNQMKSDLTAEQLYMFCKNIVQTYEYKVLNQE